MLFFFLTMLHKLCIYGLTFVNDKKFMTKTAYSTADLAAILRKTPRFVMDWCDRGLFIADIQSASGPGSRRAFSFASLLRAFLGLFLQSNYGINRTKLKEILDLLSSNDFFNDWASGFKLSRQKYNEMAEDCYNKAIKEHYIDKGKEPPTEYKFSQPYPSNYSKEDGCLIIINHISNPIIWALDMRLDEAFYITHIRESLKDSLSLIAINNLITLKIALLAKINQLGL